MPELSVGLESKLDRAIRRRQWAALLDRWLEVVPEIDPSGSEPSSDLHDQPVVTGASERLKRENGDSVSIPLGALEGAVLHEALQFLYRASNALSSAQVLVEKGAASWSLSSGYQGAYFAARALLGFLGIATVRVDVDEILINLMPLPPRPGKTSVDWPSPEVWQLGDVDHRGFWRILQRALRVTRVDGWPNRTVTLLGQVDLTVMTRLRNRLHYRARGWPLEDLTHLHREAGFAEVNWRVALDRSELDPDRKDFTLIVGLTILRLGYILLRELGAASPRFRRELDVFVNGMTEERHPMVATDWPRVDQVPV